jgi:1,2-diacylglycerol 3-alpha-glucosyltransferase
MTQSVSIDIAPPASARPRKLPDAPRRIGLINDYVRVPYANGSSFASQFLYRELSKRGHEVTVIGPRDPSARAEELPSSHLCLSSLPMRNHPGLHIPLPLASDLRAVQALSLDATIAQTGSGLMALASWLRLKRRVPALCVNTVHLPSVYDAVLPESLHDNARVQAFCRERLVPSVLSHIVSVYNHADGLVVLSAGLKDFWSGLGVNVPIHVIPRSVDPSIFSSRDDRDPFDARAARGSRLLVVCRHTREKEVARLLRIFATSIAPNVPAATLTLVGDGPDHASFRALAQELGVADRTFFPGEYPVTAMYRFYRHADLFVYTSLSETYGQVISEALWCGLPVVAFDDAMGVRHQLVGNGGSFLVPAGPDRAAADAQFARHVRRVLSDQTLRARMRETAAAEAQRRCDPDRNVDAWQAALCSAREHCARALPHARPLLALVPVERWRWLHYLMLASGLLRAPSTTDRSWPIQPGWGYQVAGAPST